MQKSKVLREQTAPGAGGHHACNPQSANLRAREPALAWGR